MARLESAAASGSPPVRRVNLSTVMRLVHEDGPLSRSDLTRATGLNRSTVGALLSELAALGRVFAGKPSADRAVGRPSPMIYAAPDTVAVAVNPDQDAVTVAVVGLNGRVRRRIRREVQTAPSAEQTVDLTAQLLAALEPELAGRQVLGIGMAVPGLVRARDGLVHMAPHLPWREVPIAQMMTEGTGLATRAENDATLGIEAEAIFGAGRGVPSLVYLHGGSGGIGSGVHMGGAHPGDGARYFPELGHLMVNSAGRRCHCGASGCLETEVSFEALRQTLGVASLDLGELAGALADQSAGRAAAEVDRQLGHLATGIRNAVNAFTPELVILGGFLGTLYDRAPQALTDAVQAQLMPPLAQSLRLARGTLGLDRILIGAAELVFQPLLSDPAGTHPAPVAD